MVAAQLAAEKELASQDGLPASDDGQPLQATGLMRGLVQREEEEESKGPMGVADLRQRRKGDLNLLLNKAQQYSNFIVRSQEESAAKGQREEEEDDEEGGGGKGGKRRKGGSGKGKKKAKGEAEKKSDSDSKAALADATAKMTKSRDQGSGQLIEQPSNMVNGTLKGYQLEGLRWLTTMFENGLNGILADEMGLGKTIQVISLFAQLRLRGVYGPMLVCAPLATLPNWVIEFKKWTPSINVLLYHGSKQERETLRTKQMPVQFSFNQEFPVVVTSFEICLADRVHLQRYDWKYIVVDEGHRIKNRESRLFNELKLLPSGNRLLLTGTPIQNKLEELWSLLNFCSPHIFDDLRVFQSWFGFHNIGKDISVEDIIDEEEKNRVVTKLHEILRPFLLRRLKKDVDIKIPEKKEVVVYANLSDYQRDLQALIEHGELREALMGMGVPDAEHISQVNQQINFRKNCCHPFLFGEPVDGKGEPIGVNDPKTLIEASGKLKLLDRMLLKLKAGKHRVLIFSQMTDVLTILEDYLRYRRWKYCRIDGSVKVTERQEAIELYNKDTSYFVFLLSTRAGGLGINLAGADTVVLFDSDWNPTQDQQAQDRCHRIGQSRNVAVYRLLTVGSVEIEMMEKQISKKKLERLSIAGGDYRKAGRRSRGKMTVENIRALLKDDVHNLQRMSTLEGRDEDISEAELDLIMDREKLFCEEPGQALPEQGTMYDIVIQSEGSLLSGFNGEGGEGTGEAAASSS